MTSEGKKPIEAASERGSAALNDELGTDENNVIPFRPKRPTPEQLKREILEKVQKAMQPGDVLWIDGMRIEK